MDLGFNKLHTSAIITHGNPVVFMFTTRLWIDYIGMLRQSILPTGIFHIKNIRLKLG
jgi:hypothetical protein